jgi:hypothetical protein
MQSSPLHVQAETTFSAFFPQDPLALLQPLGQGLINDTWLAQSRSGGLYVLQRLNIHVFPQAQQVQENWVRVVEHIHSSWAAEGATELCLFQVQRTATGASSVCDSQNSVWRLFSYIQGTSALTAVDQSPQAEALGACLGRFHRVLADLSPHSLTPPGRVIHDLPLHLAQYDALRAAAPQPEDAFCARQIQEGRAALQPFQEAQDQGKFRQQVIHGDPKVGNFLFAKDKKRVISLIDWDTVRWGPLLHDLGDALRSCCNPQGEEAQELIFQRPLFAAWLRGYLSQAADLLGPEEKRWLIESVHYISFELGLRFYKDYLAGNPYFKVQYPQQNLHRARGQFALARSIATQYSELSALLKAAT